MSLLEAIVLGIVQGLTEFLPVSSTAHLRIIPEMLGWGDPQAAFSAVIQCGTLAAVLAYFRKDIVRIAQAWFGELRDGTYWQSLDAKMGWMMILATIPIVVAGLLFKKHIDHELRSLYVISGALIVFALVLVVAEVLVKIGERAHVDRKHLEQVSWGDALTIGLAQTLALIPGTSRSGATIAAGLFRGMTREAAARFSFLLSLPAVFAAAVYELFKERAELLKSQSDIVNLVVATVVSGIVGYAAIAFLLRYLRTHTTYVFVFYRLALAAVLLGLLTSGWLHDSSDLRKTAAGRYNNSVAHNLSGANWVRPDR